MKKMNGRILTLILFVFAVVFLAGITIAGSVFAEDAVVVDFARKNLSPCAEYIFGTDWMGRDMFLRTLTGLSMSIKIGLLAAGVSSIIAFVLGTMAATMGKRVDSVITWIIDLVMGIPHILLLILISYAFGKGFKGVVIGVALTHTGHLWRD